MDESYTVTRDGWIAGRYRKAGETIRLEPAEARFLTLAGQVERERPAPPAAPARRRRD